jgi:hypothetical protein
LNRLGGALILSLLFVGCSDTREAKLRRAIQCREFADKDLANLKTELPEKVSVSLQESFYSESRSSCISVFRQSQFFADGSAADAYLVYDSVSDRQLSLFVKDGSGQNWSGTDTADIAQINVDARTALDNRLKEWR